MPALTHNRVKNGFNGGRRLLNANAGIKFGRTKGTTTADATRSDALVGGIGPRSKFVRRAINNRAISSKQGGCCHNMDKEFPKAILYYSSPGPYKSGDTVTITAVFDKRMDSNFNVKIAISGVSTSISATNMIRVNSTTYTFSHTMGSGNGENKIVLSNGKDIVGNILNDVAKNNTFEVDNTAPTLSGVIIVSNNATTTLAKAGDDVTLTFTASETIGTPVVTFTSGNAAITDTSITYANTGNIWTAVYTTNSSDTDGSVAYSIAFSDSAGNAGTAVTSGSGSVRFDKTVPTLSSVIIVSNNATTTLAKAGDDVTLTFTASETIGTPVVTFTSGNAAITDTSITYANTGNIWTAVYTTNSSDTDGSVAYSIAFSDSAGNAGTAVTSGSGSVTTDTTAPTSQNTVLAANITVTGGAAVAIASSGNISNNVWLAVVGTTTFAVNPATMTKANDGTALSIDAPTDPGTYYIYVIDQAGNVSVPSTAAITV